jgi:hypothetical protein
MSTPKLVIISQSFPPIMGGSTVLMNNLFQDYPYPLEAIIGRTLPEENKNFNAPCKHSFIKLPFTLLDKLMLRYPFPFKGIIKRFIKKELQRIKPQAAYIPYPTGYFLTYAAEVCMKMKIPYLVHMHDLWEENEKEGTYEYNLAKKKEKFILKNALYVLCMTSTQQLFYKEKYKIESIFIPHTIPLKRIIVNQAIFRKNISKRKKILYSGSISRLINRDAIEQFVRSVDLFPIEWEIVMLIKGEKEFLQSQNILHPRIKYDWVDPETSFHMQKEADILFLPLSFKNCSIQEVRTVFATKTLDYLVSGTPIFCIAPSDSYHSISAKQDGWAKVINSDKSEDIAFEIKQFAADIEAQKKVVENAFIEAERRTSRLYVEKLFNLIPKEIK